MLSTFIKRSVLQQYESLLTAAGYWPGLVGLSTFELINLFRGQMEADSPADKDVMLLNVTPSYAATVIFSDGNLIFYRCKPHPEKGSEDERVVALRREVYTSFAFYQEKLLGRGVGRVFLRVVGLPEEAVRSAVTAEVMCDGRWLDLQEVVSIGEGVDVDKREAAWGSPASGAAIGEAGVKALTINLATRPFRNNTIIGSIVAAFAIGLLVATFYNLYVFLSYGSSYALLLDDQDRNRAKLEGLQVEERSLVKQIEARDYETAFDQGSVANELILKRTFSWTELFNKLENLMPPEVMMSAIRPNVTSSTIVIRVEGVAKTHLAFLSLQEHLLAHDAFSEVYPVSIRRLNPSRPEITFILNFNYRQSERTPADTVMAQVAAPPPAESPSAATAGAIDERAALQREVLRMAAAANALPVGRDGRPRTLEVIARRMVAPGGVYDPPAVRLSGSRADEKPPAGAPQAGAATSAAQQAAATAAGAQRGTPPEVTTEPVPQAGSASRTAGSAPSVPTPTGAPAAGTTEGSAGQGTPAAGAATAGGGTVEPQSTRPQPAARADAPPKTQTPAMSRRLQRRRRAPAGTGGAQAGATGAVAGGATPQATPDAGGTTAPDAAAAPATQPAGDLNFVDRPVADVYSLLEKAHGVRFAVDAAIDRSATLTVNLSGLSLPDVITTMAEVAHHRIIELRPSIYHVVAISAGDSLVEPPIEEENLPATEGAP